ncbi:MAG: DNA-directed RNA polymerase subunit alpha C-terminal domain-containing protein, partial [Clostridia bacterium]
MGKNFRNYNNQNRQRIVDNFEPSGNAEDLQRPIEELQLFPRTEEALKAGAFVTLRDLAAKRLSQMYKVQNIGKKQCIEISRKMQKYSLCFREEEPVVDQQDGAQAQPNNGAQAQQRVGGQPNGEPRVGLRPNTNKRREDNGADNGGQARDSGQ